MDFNSWECRKGISDWGTDLSKGVKAENYKVLLENCENIHWKSLDPNSEELKWPNYLKVMNDEGNKPADQTQGTGVFNVEGYKNFMAFIDQGTHSVEEAPSGG